MREEHVDIPSVMQESPSLEIPLLALIATLAEGVEHTLQGPSDDVVTIVDEVPSVAGVSIDEVSRTMFEFSDDGSPHQIREVSGDISISEVLMGIEVPRVMTEFSDDNYPQ